MFYCSPWSTTSSDLERLEEFGIVQMTTSNEQNVHSGDRHPASWYVFVVFDNYSVDSLTFDDQNLTRKSPNFLSKWLFRFLLFP